MISKRYLLFQELNCRGIGVKIHFGEDVMRTIFNINLHSFSPYSASSCQLHDMKTYHCTYWQNTTPTSPLRKQTLRSCKTNIQHPNSCAFQLFLNQLYHLESRWRNSHVLLYHNSLPHDGSMTPGIFTYIYYQNQPVMQVNTQVPWILHSRPSDKVSDWLAKPSFNCKYLASDHTCGWWLKQPHWKNMRSRQIGSWNPNLRGENSKKYLSCHHPEKRLQL